MPAITDQRLVAVLAAYESGVDRVLRQIRDEPRPGEPADEPPARSAPRALRRPLAAVKVAGRQARGRVLDPVLDRLRGNHYPGSPGWAAQPPQRRAEWWVDRISTWAAGPAALPWLAGKLSDRLPIKDALSAAAQGLVVCAVCREYGVEDSPHRISLLAEVLTGRRIDPDSVAALRPQPGAREASDDQAMTAAPDGAAVPATDGADIGSVPPTERGVARRAGHALWTLARTVREVPGLLNGRQRGHLAARALGALPVVGVVGGYLAEHSGLQRAGALTERLLADRFGIGDRRR